MNPKTIANLVLGLVIALGAYDILRGGGGGIIPGPDPPSPKPGSWVIVIEESSERSPALARLITSDYQAELAARQLRWRIYDIDQDAARPYAQHAQKAGLPAVLVVGTTGRLLDSFTLPSDQATLDAKVKGATGL